MKRRKVAAAVACVIALSSRSTADDVLHIKSPSKLETQGGSKLELPPGYFVDEPTWAALDFEMKRLQERETRLEAENKSFRESAKEWQPGWVTLGSALIAGFTAGYFLAK